MASVGLDGGDSFDEQGQVMALVPARSAKAGGGGAEVGLVGDVMRGGLSPEMSAVLSKIGGEHAARPIGQNAANEKLRESLLRVAREHYRYVKKSETLESTLRELKDTLGKTEASRYLYHIAGGHHIHTDPPHDHITSMTSHHCI